MKYTLAIYGAPYSTQSPQTALRFASTLLSLGHQIRSVFFYHDAVHLGSTLSVVPQGEADLTRQWIDLADAHHVELVVCVAAALKRGLLNDVEAGRYGKQSPNLNTNFQIVGLGQLIDAIALSDRFVTFGC